LLTFTADPVRLEVDVDEGRLVVLVLAFKDVVLEELLTVLASIVVPVLGSVIANALLLTGVTVAVALVLATTEFETGATTACGMGCG